jgi:restriction system protein
MNLLYRFIRRLLRKNLSNPALSKLAEIDEMDGYKFEEFMKQVYEQLGYSVHHTPKSGDQGADLILTSKKRTRIAVQVKRYSGKVSNSAVQEVVAAKGFYKCTEGIVVTNSYFTDSAKQLAKANFIDLVDRNELEKLINVILN